MTHETSSRTQKWNFESSRPGWHLKTSSGTRLSDTTRQVEGPLVHFTLYYYLFSPYLLHAKEKKCRMHKMHQMILNIWTSRKKNAQLVYQINYSRYFIIILLIPSQKDLANQTIGHVWSQYILEQTLVSDPKYLQQYHYPHQFFSEINKIVTSICNMKYRHP